MKDILSQTQLDEATPKRIQAELNQTGKDTWI